MMTYNAIIIIVVITVAVVVVVVTIVVVGNDSPNTIIHTFPNTL
jgi:hypothetical protein